MLARLFPSHRLAMLPDRWVLRPAATAAQFEALFDAAAPLPALEALLDQQGVRGRLRVTLSHQHVRLFLAPAPPAWLQPAEMQIWLDAALTPALGAASPAGAWRLAWDLTPPGRPLVVAALPAALLQGLAEVCRPRGIQLAGVRPWLAEAWQRRRRQLARATGWYAVLEPGRQVLLRLQNGCVTGLRQRQAGADAAAELQGLLTREALLADLPAGGELWLERVGGRPDLQALAGRYSVHELAGPVDPAQAWLQ